MNRLRPWRAMRAAIALGCVLGAGLARAQSTDGSGDTVYRLHGSVVNGVTGKPLARALVVSQDRLLAAMSDNEGNFSIEIRVPAQPGSSTTNAAMMRSGFARFRNRLFLNVQKPGFVFPADPVSVALDDTLSSTSLKLTLMPSATIAGMVSAANTDSVANVRVLLLSRQVGNDGRRRWMPAGESTVDSRGQFHFFELRPGEYSLMSLEWRGDPPRPLRTSAVTEMYPPTFNGDRPNLEAAEKIHLHYGDNVRTELHLHEATYYPVTLPVTKLPGKGGVNVRLQGLSRFSGYVVRYNAKAGAVEGVLPTGHYDLLLTNQVEAKGPEQASPGYGSASINVENAPLQAAPLVLNPSAPIVVKLHEQLTATTDVEQPRTRGGQQGLTIGQPQVSMPPMQLMLEPEDGMGSYMGVHDPSESDDEMMLKNVPPGKYFVRAQSFHGYVASMSSGVTDLMQGPLVVGAGGEADPIDVTVRDDNPKLTGTVNVGNEAISDLIFVLVLPTDASGQFVETAADPQGRFTVNNLAPGSYRVLAFRHRPRPLAYREPGGLSQFDGKGSTITAAAGQTVQTQVELLDDSVAEEN